MPCPYMLALTSWKKVVNHHPKCVYVSTPKKAIYIQVTSPKRMSQQPSIKPTAFLKLFYPLCISWTCKTAHNNSGPARAWSLSNSRWRGYAPCRPADALTRCSLSWNIKRGRHPHILQSFNDLPNGHQFGKTISGFTYCTKA